VTKGEGEGKGEGVKEKRQRYDDCSRCRGWDKGSCKRITTSIPITTIATLTIA
jgi:hypothetical protein